MKQFKINEGIEKTGKFIKKDFFEFGDIVKHKEYPEYGFGTVINNDVIVRIKFDNKDEAWTTSQGYAHLYLFLKRDDKKDAEFVPIVYFVKNKLEFYHLMKYLDARGYRCTIGKLTSLIYDPDYQVVHIRKPFFVAFSTLEQFEYHKVETYKNNFIKKELPFEIKKIDIEDDPWEEETPTYREKLDEAIKPKTFEMSGPPPHSMWRTKADFVADMEKIGYTHTTLNKETSMLITDVAGTLKCEKARKYGIPIYSYEQAYKMFSKKMRKRLNLEDDPWSEEDWGWEEVNEGIEDHINFLEDKGVLFKTEKDYVEFLKKMEDLGYVWYITKDKPTSRNYFGSNNNIIGIKQNKGLSNGVYGCGIIPYEYLKHLEKLKKKQNLSDDPWNEEDWGWEEIRESDSSENITIVKFNSRSKYKLALSHLENNGYLWRSGHKPTEFVYWGGRNEGLRINHDTKIITASRRGMGKIFSDMNDLINSKIKRKQNLKDDPWDEENWGWEEIKENNEFNTKFSEGDRVRIRDDSSFKFQAYELGGNGLGYIKSIANSDYNGLNYRVEWDNGHYNAYGVNDLEIFNDEKKMKKIRKPDIDPWQEEDWGWEEINKT